MNVDAMPIAKEKLEFKSWICWFCDQKNIRKAYVRKFLLLFYLAQGYESIRNFFFQMDRCAAFILATAKNKFRIICKEVTICSVCRWCIFSSSLSFTDFISSISEWLTAVPEFHKFFFIESFSKLCLSSHFASISYHLIIGLKTTWLFHPLKKW